MTESQNRFSSLSPIKDIQLCCKIVSAIKVLNMHFDKKELMGYFYTKL